jgi:hypothetical protein
MFDYFTNYHAAEATIYYRDILAYRDKMKREQERDERNKVQIPLELPNIYPEMPSRLLSGQ